MSVTVSIIDGPLAPRVMAPDTACQGRVGALLVFEGIVRRAEEGGDIEALAYEAYEPMASLVLEKIAAETVEAHGLLSLRVEHSRGEVPVGSASLRVTIESAHRGASLAAMAAFIDLLKRDVPIWKKPVRGT